MGKDIRKKIKKILVVTGGAGFVGSNLIELLLKKTKYDIISIDNYSSGSKQNHFESNRVKYIAGNTKNISLYLNKFKKKNYYYFSFWRIF